MKARGKCGAQRSTSPMVNHTQNGEGLKGRKYFALSGLPAFWGF
jgi:hypothetical protein